MSRLTMQSPRPISSLLVPIRGELNFSSFKKRRKHKDNSLSGWDVLVIPWTDSSSCAHLLCAEPCPSVDDLEGEVMPVYGGLSGDRHTPFTGVLESIRHHAVHHLDKGCMSRCIESMHSRAPSRHRSEHALAGCFEEVDAANEQT